MLNSDVDEEKLKNGEYCRKEVPGCFCKVGWSEERRCPECGGAWDSYCVCPPVERIFNKRD
jgi:hypothetical protein